MTKTSRQRQRHGRRDHEADAPAKADQTDHHDHAERHEELEHEFIDGFTDIDRLIRDLGEGEAGGQFRRNRLLLGLQRLAEVQAVPAILHDDAEHQRRLAVVADQEGGRVLVAALDIGDIGQLQRPSA